MAKTVKTVFLVTQIISNGFESDFLMYKELSQKITPNDAKVPSCTLFNGTKAFKLPFEKKRLSSFLSDTSRFAFS